MCVKTVLVDIYGHVIRDLYYNRDLFVYIMCGLCARFYVILLLCNDTSG